jgi:CBS-domain-containing membrane protein
MSGHKLRRIPVVDNNNAIVGIIAQADLATRADQAEKPLRWLGKFRNPTKVKGIERYVPNW